MSIQNNFPAIRPSLNLDFANTKELDPRITFARASTATYYGTQTAKAEENLLLQSQGFDSSAWNRQAISSSANTAVAPDGTTTAETLTSSVGAGIHALIQTSGAFTSGRVASIFVKAGTHSFVQISFNGDAAPFANFTVTAGAGAVGSVGTNQTASIVDVGNGWFRCVVYTASTTATNFLLVIVDSSSSVRLQDWTTAGTETVFAWGAQLEQRSAVTAYTPTTTQPITNYIPVLETAASGVARFDHNPTTFESLGFLVEEQRTNLLTYSEEFDNAAWTKSLATITANTIVAPDGTLTSDKLIPNSGETGGAAVLQTLSKTATATTYALSAYVKAAEFPIFRLYFRDTALAANRCEATFDVSTGVTSGVVNAGTFSGAAASMTLVGNGWYRCVLIATTSTETSIQARITNAGSGQPGDGYSGIYIWGAQLEAGAFPTSYIPTEASQVTRAADAASMTGVNFSSWYRADEGTLYVEASAPTSANVIATISDNTNSNRMLLQQGTNSRSLVITTNAVTQASLSVTATFNQYAKAAAAFAANSCQIASNTVLGVEDTDLVLPVVDRVYIGANQVGTAGFLNGHIRKLAYYPKRLSNVELQGLTTP